jgi:hypothetical protein
VGAAVVTSSRPNFFLSGPDRRGSCRYNDAIKRIDKQITDDQDDADGDSRDMAAFCGKSKQALSAVCQVPPHVRNRIHGGCVGPSNDPTARQAFGPKSESCKTTELEFAHKCVRGSGSDPFFFVWCLAMHSWEYCSFTPSFPRFCSQQLYAATELAPNNVDIFIEAGGDRLTLTSSLWFGHMLATPPLRPQNLMLPAEMALNMHRSPDGPIIYMKQTLG